MKKLNSKIKRRFRNRKKLKKVGDNKLRVSVSKSLNNISAQIIDDTQKKTIVFASSIESAADRGATSPRTGLLQQECHAGKVASNMHMLGPKTSQELQIN